MNLDPALTGNGSPQVWFTRPAYDPLIIHDADGKAVPGLATEWGYSEDRLSFTLKLREGVKFSDGTELTAEGAVASMEYWKANTQFGQYLANVAEIVASGPMELTLKLSNPDPLLEYVLDQNGQSGSIIGPKGLENPSMLGTESVGAGP
ncbi:MAG: ABC transporter substrate-binding protein, partial [Propionibacteriaceae bacterium]|nr:ABC transporter substrate-binding protein [Propionibacteriaceae bacterium]